MAEAVVESILGLGVSMVKNWMGEGLVMTVVFRDPPHGARYA
jgi:hypothetical protein